MPSSANQVKHLAFIQKERQIKTGDNHSENI